MKYIDEQIEITVDLTGLHVTESRAYPYLITKKDRPSATANPIFAGSLYLTSGQTTVTVDITDIARDYQWVPDVMDLEKTVDDESASTAIHQCQFEIVINNSPYTVSSGPVTVTYSMRYPNRQYSYDVVVYDSFNPTGFTSLLLEGSHHNQYPRPIIPNTTSPNYRFGFAVVSPGTFTTITAIDGDNTYHVEECPKTMFMSLEQWQEYIDEYNTEGVTVKTFDTLLVDGKVFAKVDNNGCSHNANHRYYLCWQDRAGGFQSQPFCGDMTFSNKYDTTTITDYKERIRPVGWSIESSWKINTNWIDTLNYPYYESIFTSPYLILYDGKEDKAYNVYVTDKNYTEKTFRNQGKKLFNLQLNVTLTRKQRRIG